MVNASYSSHILILIPHLFGSQFRHVRSVNFIQLWVGSVIHPTEEHEGGSDGSFRVFTHRELVTATRGFHPSEKVGEGGFGSVYKVIYALTIFLCLVLN